MKRVMRLVAFTGLMTLGGAWLTAAPAGATAPEVFHSQIDDTFIGVTDFCGFTVDIVVQGTDTFQVFFDRFGNVSRIQDESHVVQTITNEANGKVVYQENSSHFSEPAPVVNADGTITLTDTFTGLPERIYTDHSNTLTKDVGYIAFVATFDANGNFISQEVIEHGPHPDADSDFELFCDAITAAIG
jgi:hypothetical protein